MYIATILGLSCLGDLQDEVMFYCLALPKLPASLELGI